jgi:hypothetical protein
MTLISIGDDEARRGARPSGSMDRPRPALSSD